MSHELWLAVLQALWQTLYMVFVSGGLATFVGLPLGVILFTTQTGQVLEHLRFNKILGGIVNALRSVPFIILLVAIIPFTRLIVGTSIGTTAAIVPLTLAAIPFVARIIENVLQEVPVGLVEAGLALGATPFQIIRRILLPEAMSGVINGMTVMLITLVGYSAMAGAVGGGGLGDLAIRYGYERFNMSVMLVTVLILIVLVQLMQMLGERLARHFSKG